jgi:hypothetical protein
VKVDHPIRRGIEHDGLASHVAELTRAGEEESPGTAVVAHRQRLTVEGFVTDGLCIVLPRVCAEVGVQSAARDPRRDIDDRRILVAVLGVPAARDEVDLIDHLRIEQLVQAPRHPGRNGDAIDVVRVLGVLPADVHLAGRRARGAGDRRLQNLRRRIGRSAVVVVLLEHLIAGPSIHGDWYGCRHGDGGETHRRGDHLEIEVSDVGLTTRDRDRPGHRMKTEEPDENAVAARRQVVDVVMPERIGLRVDDNLAAARHAHFSGRQWLGGCAVGDGATDVGSGWLRCRGLPYREQQREHGNDEHKHAGSPACKITEHEFS